MASEVIKKDGSREAFDPEKIRKTINAAAQRCDIPEDRKNEIINKVTGAAVQMASEREEITTAEIRDKILSELDIIEPQISSSWRQYDQDKA